MTEEEKKLFIVRMGDAMPVMRKTLKLTQSELSTLPGVSRSVISNVERGLQPLGWDAFLAVTAVFQSNPICKKLFEIYGIDLEQIKKYLCVENQKS